MDIRIEPKPLLGDVTPPPSKSMAHRLLIAAALAKGNSVLRNVEFSQDIEATLRCLTALGGRWDRLGPEEIVIRGIGGRRLKSGKPYLDCGESGSTLRFLLPVALALTGGGVFTGHGRLMERPLAPYFSLFDEKGIFYNLQDGILTVRGTLPPGEYRLPGNVSSQFFTGLLFALPLLDGPSIVTSTTELESSGYVAMTVEAMRRAGVTVQSGGGTHYTTSPTEYRPFDAMVEADWSQAAFWYAANALGSSLNVLGLDNQSVQGDRIPASLFSHMKHRSENLTVDVSGCPDMVPPLAAAAAVRRGDIHLVNAARLRLKESDRLATVCRMVLDLGGSAEEKPDSLLIHGRPFLRGGVVDGCNDHRIVMAAAVAACACRKPVTILGAEAVKKSYPNFWEEYRRLGGSTHVI